MPKNIAVLVSGGGSNLQALIDAQAKGRLENGRITLVISSIPDAYALTRAKNAGISTKIVDKKSHPDRAGYTKAILTALEGEEIELVVLAGFMFILDGGFFDKYNAINVHPSLIPAFCGAGFYGLKVHKAALDKGVKVTGATVHFVIEGCDEGPIILQKAVPVLADDTPEVLQKRVMEQAEWVILPKAVSMFCKGEI